MPKTSQIVVRLDPESVRVIDQMPGANRSEKLRNLIAQRGVVAALLDDQKAMLGDVRKAVSDLARKQPPAQPQSVPAASAPAGVWTPQELASLYQALALVANAIGKPMMSSEAANFCASKVREITARK